VSALLLIAPWLRRGLTVSLPDGVTSRPYVTMTLQLLRRLGADVRGSVDGAPAEVFVGPAHEPEEAMPAIRPDKRVTVLATRLGVAPFDLAIEPDASSAGYFWAAAAMCPGSRARVMFEAVTGDNASAAAPARGDGGNARNGHGRERTAASPAESLGGWGAALQGDVHLVDLLERMGAQVERTASHFAVTGPETLRGIDADLADIPDAAMALSVVCCFARGPSTLRGLRVKETDRLAALSAELTRVGVGVEILSDGDGEALRITPPAAGLRSRPPAGPVRLETYRDHRMAMALALFGLALPGIEVADPGCVAKTYPAYWRDLWAMIG
jgi:5-enolpyruvylshikimate-3-phosphate synthase